MYYLMDEVIDLMDILLKDENYDDEVHLILSGLQRKSEVTYEELKEIKLLMELKLRSLGVSQAVCDSK